MRISGCDRRSPFQISMFGCLKILKNQKRGQGPLVSRRCCLNSFGRSPVRARDTMSGDAAVNACRRWPPPHVVPDLSPHCVEQRMVSPTLASLAHARHHCALSPSVTEALSVPATFIRCPNPTLPPQAPPSPRVAHRPHHERPQRLPHAPIARSPPLRAHRQPASLAISRRHPYLREDHSALEYISTVSTPEFPRFFGPSPMLPYTDRHRCCEPSSGDPPPCPTPNKLPLDSGKDTGPTFPGSPPWVGRNRPTSRRLPLFPPWAKHVGRTRPSASVG
jgi:hypothetical protein